MAKNGKVKTLKIECLKTDNYALDPAVGPIVKIEKGTIDHFPIKFAHDMVAAGSFKMVDAKDAEAREETGDVAERLAIIADREAVLNEAQMQLEVDQDQLKTDQEQLKADREQFEADKQKFADIAGKSLDEVMDDNVEVGAGDNTPDPDEKKDTDKGKPEEVDVSVADQCANIVKTAKNEKAAKKALIAYAKNNLKFELDKKFDSTTMTEKIIQEAKAQSEQSANNGK